MPTTEKCFSCNKPLHRARIIAVTTDGQTVYVGPDCYRKIIEAGTAGYQPPLGGPKLLTFYAAAELERQSCNPSTPT